MASDLKKESFSIPIRMLYKNLCFFCVFIHYFLVIFFIILNAFPLVILNAASVVVYLGALYLTSKNHFTMVTIIAFVEICANALISSLAIGWDYGFYFYAISIIPLVFYCEFKYRIMKILLCLMPGIVFVFTYFICNSNEPFLNVNDKFCNLIYIINSLICIMTLTLLSCLYSKSSKNTSGNLYKENIDLQKLAETDPLTGLCNRRSMLLNLDEAKIQYSSNGENFVIILMDIDDFKLINDKYGHSCGDYVLKEISRILRNTLRKEDIICRWGGEEILVLISNVNIDIGKKIAEKIRVNISEESFNCKTGTFNITITAGVCSSEDMNMVESIVNIADKCLYKGKASGKNCVISTR